MDNGDIRNSDSSHLSQSKPFIRRHWVILTLLLVSLLIRIAYFAEIIKGPCYKQHLWDQSDMNFFHSWAQQLVDGDWLINKPLHPYHNWHERVADNYFRSYRERHATLHRNSLPLQVDMEAKRQLWNRWYGGTRYHQEPLYPYVVAVIYRLFGVRVAWVFLFQLSIGIASVFLIYDITMRLFDSRVAAIAGTLAVLCGPLLFFEMVLLRSTLISFFGLFFVWLILNVQNAESALSWVRIGLFFGISVLLKSTFLIFLAGIIAYLIFRHRHSVKRALIYSSALIAGVIISLSPLMVRNVAVGTSPLGLSSVTAVTFLSANAGDSHPRGFFVSENIASVMDKTNGAVIPTVIETLKTQSISRYALLVMHKFMLMLHWYEIPNNANFYYYRLHSYVLRFLPITFLILAPLGIVGVGLAICERRRCAPLYLLLSMHVVSILIVYVSARFRNPMIAALLPFSALTVARIGESLEKRNVRRALLICVFLTVVSFWTMSPLPKWLSLIRAADCAAPYGFYYRPLLLAADAEGNLAMRIRILKGLLRSEPQSIRRLGSGSPPENQSDRDTALLFSRFRRMYVNALLGAERKKEARIVMQRAKELERLSRM
jgi:4-amino-4-deoxy-L-arabinose transferase-like glycosyltransferase